MKYKNLLAKIFAIGLVSLAPVSLFSWQQEPTLISDSLARPAPSSVRKKDTLRQNKPEKKRTFEDWQREQDSLHNVELKLPHHLQLMKRPLREVIAQMKADGVSSANARNKNAARKYSTHFVVVDSLANISTSLYVRGLNVNDIDQLISLGTKIRIYSREFHQVDASLINKLRSLGVIILPAYKEGPGDLTCLIPFDAMIEVAKLRFVIGIETGSNGEIKTGTITSKGDTVLGAYKARSYFYANGSGIKVGIISDGVDYWTSDTASGDLPVLQVLSAV